MPEDSFHKSCFGALQYGSIFIKIMFNEQKFFATAYLLGMNATV